MILARFLYDVLSVFDVLLLLSPELAVDLISTDTLCIRRHRRLMVNWVRVRDAYFSPCSFRYIPDNIDSLAAIPIRPSFSPFHF